MSFGSQPAVSFIVNNANSITAISPAAGAGTVDVTVTTPGGTSATTIADQFTYSGPPTATTQVASTVATAGTSVSFTPVTASGGAGTVTYSISPSLPAGLSIDPSTGLISGTPSALLAQTTFTVTATDSAQQTSTANFSLTVNAATLTAASAVPSTAATVNVPVTPFTPVSTSGGFGTLTYSVSPSLPAGLAMDPGTGQISGTPTVALGTTTFTVQVSDQTTPTPQQVSQSFSLSVAAPPALSSAVMAPTTIVTANAAITPFTPVTGSGGYGTLNYSVSPNLPAGLSLNTSTGQISGTPTVLLPTATFAIAVADGAAQTSSQNFSLTVVPQTLTTTQAVPATIATANSAMSAFKPVTAAGGFGTLTYNVAPNLPQGLSFSTTTGQISGTPTALLPATPFTVTVTDQTTPSMQSSSQTFSLAVAAPLLTASQAVATTVATANNPLTAFTPVTTTGGFGTLTYSVSPNLPAGLTFSAATGQITGTPTALLQTTNFTVTVTDQTTPSKQSVSNTFSLTVNPIPLTTAQAVPASSVSANAPLTAFIPVTAAGGFGTLTYSLSPGLPAGLTFSTATGQISGTPTALLQPTTYTVTVTDQTTPSKQSSQQTFSLAVTPLGLSLTQAATSVTATAGVALTAIAPVTATGGFGALTYSVSPNLPAGLMLDPATGQISGTPTALLQTATFTLSVKDQATPSVQVASKAFSLTVNPQTLSTSPAVPATNVNANAPIAPFTPVTASGGFGTLTYGISPALPAGLSFSTATGQITGTPTALLQTATFSVTVTDQTSVPANQTSSQTFQLTVAAPLLVATLAVPATEATANLPITPFTPVTATGGFGTLTYAVAPALPTGLSFSTTTGQITGTPTALIAATSFTVTVTDQTTPVKQSASGIFSLAVTKVSTQLVLTETASSVYYGAPVTFTASVAGGRAPTGSVTFSDGSKVLATVALSGASASLTIKTLAAGSHTIGAVYSGDPQNTSSTASLSLAVNTRPNPAQDPDVTGLVETQVTTAERFGQTQIDNTVRRLEDLHDEDDSDDDPGQAQGPAPGVATGAPARPGASGTGMMAVNSAAQPGDAPLGVPASGPARLPGSPGLPAGTLAYVDYGTLPGNRPQQSDSARAIQTLAGGLPMAVAALDRKHLLPFSIWMSGSLDFGKLRPDGGSDRRFTTSGLTLGADGRIVGGLKAGVALGFGLDRTFVGSNGSRSDGQMLSAMVYADYRIAPHIYLDATAGYGSLRFDLARWSTDGNVMLSGHRHGADAFGSLGLTRQFRWQGFKLSPYGRFDLVRVMLDPYGETGSPIWALTYDRLATTTTSGVLGTRIAYPVSMSWGVLTPMARLEYRHQFAGGFTQGLNYSDLPGMPAYVVPGAAIAQDSLTGGITLRAQTNDFRAMEVEYLLTGGIGRQPMTQQVRASARLRF